MVVVLMGALVGMHGKMANEKKVIEVNKKYLDK